VDISRQVWYWVAEDEHDCNVGDVDRMDKMFEAIQAEVTEDPPTMEVEAFFKLLNASKEPLHEHTKVTFLAFITRLVAIMSKYFFSNNCYNDLLKLINDIEGPEKATRGGGGEWEPIKIPCRNLAYIPKST
jgi:hypothetical protein